MSVAARIWYGTAQASKRDDAHGVSWFGPIACLLLFAVRLCLPMEICDTGLVYASAAEGLVVGADWAKQALVGAVEYPPFPLIVSAAIFGGVKLVGVTSAISVIHVLVAAAQIWVLSYAWRIFRLYLSVKTAVIPVFGAAAVLVAFGGAAGDPTWLMAVPAAGTLFHVARFEQHGNLRDLAIVGLNGGILALCGGVGILIGLLGCLMLWLSGGKIARRAGGFFLLMLPIIYVSLLYPLANWLVMGNPMFFLERLGQGSGVWSVSWTIPLVALGAAVAISAVPKVRTTTRLAVAWSIALMTMSLLAASRGLFFADFGVLCVVAGLAAVTGVASAVLRSPGKGPMIASVVAALLALPAAFLGYGDSREDARFSDSGSPPDPEAMIELIDQHWQGSRILVFDLRTAALYGQHQSERFVASLDYNPYVFDEITGVEQMHLLVPPNNGRFYGRQHKLLARAHAGEGERLFLEEVWPGDWQLWRCVRPIRPEALGMTGSVP